MNRNQLALLLGLLIVLGGAGLLVQRSRNHSASTTERGAGGKLLGDKFEVNDIAHIGIKQGTNEANLVKKDIWRVRERNDYPANYSQITEFLLKAAELKIIQTEQVGPSQLARLQLAPEGTNAAVSLDLSDKNDKPVKTVMLGKMHTRKAPQNSQFGDEGFPDGRYVMLAGDKQNALLIADPLNSIEPKPEQWLDKNFFKVERPKAVAVMFPTATNSWKIARDGESGEWKLEVKADGQVDSNKIAGVTSPFASPTFNDVLSKSAMPEDNGLDKPTIVTVDTFDDFIYTLKVGKKSGDDYPMTMAVSANFPKDRPIGTNETAEIKAKADKAWADRQKQLDEKLKSAKAFENWTYLVPTYCVEPVLKERKDLLVEKTEEKPAEKTDSAADKKEESKPADKPGAPRERN